MPLSHSNERSGHFSSLGGSPAGFGSRLTQLM
jgi:hypothetical protein